MGEKFTFEHRKQKHRVRIDSKLLRWLWEDPTRLPKARDDMARWTGYMATETSNPAFQIFLSMAWYRGRTRRKMPVTLKVIPRPSSGKTTFEWRTEFDTSMKRSMISEVMEGSFGPLEVVTPPGPIGQTDAKG